MTATSRSGDAGPPHGVVERHQNGVLHLVDRELASCVACGLCLPHCPTYRATGEESASPRGRIAAMRAVQWDGRPLDQDFTRFMDLCVQCRACEVVCPSSVPFGRLMEGARETLAAQTSYQPRRWRLAYTALARHRLLLAGSTLLAVAQRLHLVPRRASLPALAASSISAPAPAWCFVVSIVAHPFRPLPN